MQTFLIWKPSMGRVRYLHGLREAAHRLAERRQ
jgi:hypothetical protein